MSFLQQVCGLELPGDIGARAKAYQDSASSACYWWPNSRFLMVSERPKEIHTIQVQPRGWGSHVLHNEDGPAIAWETWGLYAIRGVRVPEKVVMSPDSITAADITTEPNAEVRRVMLERVGLDRYIADAGARKVHTDDWGVLYTLPAAADGDDALWVVKVTNSTPEPDGTYKDYFLSVRDPQQTYGERTARAAVASTWVTETGEQAFAKPEDYVLEIQT